MKYVWFVEFIFIWILSYVFLGVIIFGVVILLFDVVLFVVERIDFDFVVVVIVVYVEGVIRVE